MNLSRSVVCLDLAVTAGRFDLIHRNRGCLRTLRPESARRNLQELKEFDRSLTLSVALIDRLRSIPLAMLVEQKQLQLLCLRGNLSGARKDLRSDRVLGIGRAWAARPRTAPTRPHATDASQSFWQRVASGGGQQAAAHPKYVPLNAIPTAAAAAAVCTAVGILSPKCGAGAAEGTASKAAAAAAACVSAGQLPYFLLGPRHVRVEFTNYRHLRLWPARLHPTARRGSGERGPVTAATVSPHTHAWGTAAASERRTMFFPGIFNWTLNCKDRRNASRAWSARVHMGTKRTGAHARRTERSCLAGTPMPNGAEWCGGGDGGSKGLQPASFRRHGITRVRPETVRP